MYTVQEVIVYIVLIVYREYGEEEEEDGDTHSTIRRQSVIIEGLTMETDELRVRTPTSLFLLYVPKLFYLNFYFLQKYCIKECQNYEFNAKIGFSFSHGLLCAYFSSLMFFLRKNIIAKPPPPRTVY